MKIILPFATLFAATLPLLPLCAQPGMAGGMGGVPGPRFDAALAKLFGEHTGFTATMENQVKDPARGTMFMPGKLAFLEGKSRLEMDLTKARGAGIPAGGAEQMKAMGMDTMIAITRPDKKLRYQVYPGLKAYAESPLTETENTEAEKFKIESEEAGQETVEGRACVKHKVTITDARDRKREFLVWKATDLQQFPIKMEYQERGADFACVYKDLKLTKPDAGLFDPPAGYTEYDNVMTLMQQEMMKRMGGGLGLPGR